MLCLGTTPRCLALLLAVSGLACDREDATEILVEVYAEEPLDMLIDRVEVSVRGGLSLDELDPPYTETMAPPTFPFRIAVVPKNGDARRVFRVEVLAYTGATLVGTVRARGQFIESRLVQLPLVLEACCADVAPTCTPTQTCRDCLCVDETVAQDGGTRDGGAADGAADGGVGDGNMPTDGTVPTTCVPGAWADTTIPSPNDLALVPFDESFALVYADTTETYLRRVNGDLIASGPRMFSLDALALASGDVVVAGTTGTGLALFDVVGDRLTARLTVPEPTAVGPFLARGPTLDVATTCFVSGTAHVSVFMPSAFNDTSLGAAVGGTTVVWSPEAMRWVIVHGVASGTVVSLTVGADGFAPTMPTDLMRFLNPRGLQTIDGGLLLAGMFGTNTMFHYLTPDGALDGSRPEVALAYTDTSGTIGSSNLVTSADRTIAAVARFISPAPGGTTLVDIGWIQVATGTAAAASEEELVTTSGGGAIAIARNGDQWMVAFAPNAGTVQVRAVCPP